MMNPACKSLVALLAGLALASCGGGGGDGGGATSPPQSGQIVLTPNTTSLPLNPGNVLPYPGSPFMAEVGITFRDASGRITSPEGDATVTINPPTVVTLSPPDDPETEDINEMAQRIVTFPITLNNGSAVIFATSYDVAGTAVLTASAVDPITGRTVSTTLEFTVSTGVGAMPASIEAAADPALVYAPSSGGRSNTAIRAVVRDGGGQFVADPGSGNDIFDNVRFEIVGDAGGATLSTQSASGTSSGTSVTTHTIRGIATASLQVTDATPQDAPVEIRIIADGADNDVSNGITSPVTTTAEVIATDGELYSVRITSPVFAPRLPGITINRLPAAPGVEPEEPGDDGIPVDPDATLSLTVTAQASDHHGRPVVPGTLIAFGLVHEPVDHENLSNTTPFLIYGKDGNPQQNGSLFTAPTGHFFSAGGGVIPGDALVLFGWANQGYEDLTSAHTVLSPVNTETSLNATPVFNYINTNRPAGPVIPYLIGRSGNGNNVSLDESQGATDAEGRVHAKVNYKVRDVGAPFALWAQGNGIDRNHGNITRRVADSLVLSYPGVAPASMTAFPNPIAGNGTVDVFVCVTDALGIPLRGVPIAFSFTDLQGGSGNVDGNGAAGILDSVTGTDGCATASVTTSGLSPAGEGGSSGTLTFSGAGATASVDILVQVGFLSASPANVCASTPANITITSYSSGQSPTPLPDVAVTAACDAGITITPTSATTGSNGSAVFEVVAEDDVDAQCVFSAAGARSVTVGVAGSGGSISPACP
jgi:hypothetical protein